MMYIRLSRQYQKSNLLSLWIFLILKKKKKKKKKTLYVRKNGLLGRTNAYDIMPQSPFLVYMISFHRLLTPLIGMIN